MDIVIFCGGRGTRLSEKTKEIPKPLVEVGDYPIIWHLMKVFSHYNHKRFLLTLGYKGNLMKQWFLNYRYDSSFDLDFSSNETPKTPSAQVDWKVLLKDTGLDSGTSYRLKLVEKDIKSEQFIVTYGDGLADIDIDALITYHNKMRTEKGVIATMSMFQPTSKYGIVDFNEEGIIAGFQEKPQVQEWANMGYIVCEKEIFDYITEDQNSMLVRDVFPKLAKLGKLAGFKHTGWFEPMDTFKDYVTLNNYWQKNEAPWKLWEK